MGDFHEPVKVLEVNSSILKTRKGIDFLPPNTNRWDIYATSNFKRLGLNSLLIPVFSLVLIAMLLFKEDALSIAILTFCQNGECNNMPFQGINSVYV